MPVIFKQNFDAFNQEFDEYFEVLFLRFDPDFCEEVQEFAKKLVRYLLKMRMKKTKARERVASGNVPGAVLIAGQLSLLTAKMLEQSIDEKLNDDFPKFVGTKTNFWRYLLRFIPAFVNEVDPPNYTKEFSMATACLLELNFYCAKVGQFHLVEDFRVFWFAMFLHFFGERFRGRDKCAFLSDLKLPSERKCEGKPEMEPFEIIVTVEMPREAETEVENKSKKSRKKNKKRHK